MKNKGLRFKTEILFGIETSTIRMFPEHEANWKQAWNKHVKQFIFHHGSIAKEFFDGDNSKAALVWQDSGCLVFGRFKKEQSKNEWLHIKINEKLFSPEMFGSWGLWYFEGDSKLIVRITSSLP